MPWTPYTSPCTRPTLASVRESPAPNPTPNPIPLVHITPDLSDMVDVNPAIKKLERGEEYLDEREDEEDTSLRTTADGEPTNEGRR